MKFETPFTSFKTQNYFFVFKICLLNFLGSIKVEYSTEIILFIKSAYIIDKDI